jgi:phosphatidylglycerol:prolipoprotein diacylglycerol transferase
MAPAVLLAQGIARVGCDVYGKVMAQVWPWGVEFQNRLVHPVQIYETILDLVLLIFLWRKKEHQHYSGQIFVYYLGGYALIRMVLEFFRTSPILIGGLTPAHLTSTLFIIAALILDRWCSKKGDLKSERTSPASLNNKGFSAAVIVLLIACIEIFYGLNGI